MNLRQKASLKHVEPLLTLIEQRFDVSIETTSADHLRSILDHYNDNREFFLKYFGESAALAKPEYAKAVLISEAAKMILREIRPRPKKKKKNKGNS